MSTVKGVKLNELKKDMDETCEKYKDILDLPHHVSIEHPQMPISDRAAQFAPFAALTGLSAAMEETAEINEKNMDRRAEEILPIEDV